ncbi:MAG: enoyl-CoA hydratase-related protein [Actinomycetota bacterium]|nr:enoyl-CoA hydratase-related protein [Actinomycetota bacterium]
MTVAAETGLVVARVDDGIGVLRLSDPARRNALGKEMSDALAEQTAGVLAGGARAIVVTAEPPVFCAGGSLDNLLSGEHPLEAMFAGYQALAGAPVPTVAAVAGPALGAGLNLALACDVVLASESARFESRFMGIGMHPGGGHLWRLARRAGRQGAAAMVLFGESLDGEQAVRVGLAWRCYADDEVEPAALDLARRAAARPAGLVARAKETLRAAAADGDGDRAFEVEMDAQRWSMSQPDFEAAVRAMKARIQEGRAGPPG